MCVCVGVCVWVCCIVVVVCVCGFVIVIVIVFVFVPTYYFVVMTNRCLFLARLQEKAQLCFHACCLLGL